MHERHGPSQNMEEGVEMLTNPPGTPLTVRCAILRVERHQRFVRLELLRSSGALLCILHGGTRQCQLLRRRLLAWVTKVGRGGEHACHAGVSPPNCCSVPVYAGRVSASNPTLNYHILMDMVLLSLPLADKRATRFPSPCTSLQVWCLASSSVTGNILVHWLECVVHLGKQQGNHARWQISW